MADPFGQAILDHARGERDEPLLQRDGQQEIEHPIEALYFDGVETDANHVTWLDDRVEAPLLDVGAGAGRHVLHFQEAFETVAVEVSDTLVTAMDERGVEDARQGDLFDLTRNFEPDRFRTVLVVGTQLGLGTSMRGVREGLAELATVTTDDATAIVDSYDPSHPDAEEMLGRRDDPTPGAAFRVMHFEYEGIVGETLLFRVFDADWLREVVEPTDWSVADVQRSDDWGMGYYRAALTKD
ncbi:class I SAM-dependent methyltransferase [Halobacteriales archaeon Cl-PHB]